MRILANRSRTWLILMLRFWPPRAMIRALESGQFPGAIIIISSRALVLTGTSAPATMGSAGFLTGGDKLVLRGGYSRTNDYAFTNIALNIWSAFPFVAAFISPTAPVTLPGESCGQ